MTSAFFNGAFLDLTGVIESVTGINLNPSEGLAIGNVGLNLGGLLNITPFNGSPTTPPTEYNGGVLWNQLGAPAGATGFVADNIGVGIPTGHWGSWVGYSQSLAKELKVTPPLKSAAAAPAAAAVEAPAAPVVAEAPAPVAVEAAVVAEAPAPAVVEAPAAPAKIDIPAAAEAPAAPAPAVAEAPAQRGGGGNNKSDNGSSAKGHRGA
jgi:hypothetical protein